MTNLGSHETLIGQAEVAHANEKAAALEHKATQVRHRAVRLSSERTIFAALADDDGIMRDPDDLATFAEAAMRIGGQPRWQARRSAEVLVGMLTADPTAEPVPAYIISSNYISDNKGEALVTVTNSKRQPASNPQFSLSQPSGSENHTYKLSVAAGDGELNLFKHNDYGYDVAPGSTPSGIKWLLGDSAELRLNFGKTHVVTDKWEAEKLDRRKIHKKGGAIIFAEEAAPYVIETDSRANSRVPIYDEEAVAALMLLNQSLRGHTAYEFTEYRSCTQGTLAERMLARLSKTTRGMLRDGDDAWSLADQGMPLALHAHTIKQAGILPGMVGQTILDAIADSSALTPPIMAKLLDRLDKSKLNLGPIVDEALMTQVERVQGQFEQVKHLGGITIDPDGIMHAALLSPSTFRKALGSRGIPFEVAMVLDSHFGRSHRYRLGHQLEQGATSRSR